MAEGVEPPLDPEENQCCCAWCERTLRADEGGFWETEGDDGRDGWYCSAECLLASL